MRIALDYDGTYTRDPNLWNKFILMFKNAGHQINFVTMRFPSEGFEKWLSDTIDFCSIIYTSRKAKKIYCEENDIHFDIWIDDHPEWLFQNG